jgi:hypothetical protein
MVGGDGAKEGLRVLTIVVGGWIEAQLCQITAINVQLPRPTARARLPRR